MTLLVSLMITTLSASTGLEGASWDQTIKSRIRHMEYNFSNQEPGIWMAPNRGQHLRSFVSKDGLRVIPRSRSAEPWTFELQLTGVGRGQESIPTGPVEVHAEENRIELAGAWLTEWFVNEPTGLEHGFTIAERPEIGQSESPLFLEMRLGGTVRAQTMPNGSAIVLDSVDTGKRVMRYAGLIARDARGVVLDGELKVQGRKLQIVIDDLDAAYPIIIDPTVTTSDWVSEGGFLNGSFGFSVSGAGDVNNDGYADVIVGANDYDNGQISEGRIFVYHGSSGGPSLSPDWTAESDQDGADFGVIVRPAGDVNDDGVDDVIIGAHRYEDFETNEGWVFVFYGQAGNGLNTNGVRPVGSPANADWIAQANQNDANFGISVAGAGDVNGDNIDDIIIGADEYTNGQSFEGAVFAYYGSVNGLVGPSFSRPIGTPANADWSAEPNQVNADFGVSIDIVGDIDNDTYDDVVIGSWNWDLNKLDEGRAWAFHGSASGLETTPQWTYDGDQDEAFLGFSVAGAGDVNNDGFDDVIIGADGFTIGGVDSGAAFVFHGSAAGLVQSPAWTGSNNQGVAEFGSSVAGAGDFNNDGFDDVIVGAAQFDNVEIDEGAAYLYLGSESGLSLTPARSYEADQTAAQLGISVRGAGDVDNDGYDDVLFGADQFNTAPDLCQNLTCSEGGNPCVTDLNCLGGSDACLGLCSFSAAVCSSDPNCPGASEGAAFLFFGCEDVDRDGVCNADDNCSSVTNPEQTDTDGDGAGDVCDPCTDSDGDSFCDADLVFVTWEGPGEEVLIQEGTGMRFYTNTSDPGFGLTWTEELYNDSAWTLGSYGVGYETATGAENLITTTVPSGAKSIYTRTTFDVANVDNVQNLFFGADYDDGYVVWINGQEVLRSTEMGAAGILWDTNPTPTESSNGQNPNYGSLIDVSFAGLPALHNGTNSVSIGVWNTFTGSSDLVIVPRLSINRSTSTTLNYLANTSDPGIGTSWTQLAFNDSSWARGNYGVGYEEGLGADELINTDTDPGLFSIYTRSKFNVAVSAVQQLLLSADYDDGIVAWINGAVVYQSPGMPASPLWNHDATAHESTNAATPDFSAPIDITSAALAALNTGENVLALGVWNNGAPADDDLVVAAQLAVRGASLDNCSEIPNPGQEDLDGDGVGDVCDPDIDGDGDLNENDNCPLNANADQANDDGDALGNVCDACPQDPANDSDADGLCSNDDNCPTVFNPDQTNSDIDGLGDACDTDDDNDGVLDPADNCPIVFNPAPQDDTDSDTYGDPCDCDLNNNQIWQQPVPANVIAAKSDACAFKTCSEGFNACNTDSDCLLGGTDLCGNGTCTVGANACNDDSACVLGSTEILTWDVQTVEEKGATTATYDTMLSTTATTFVSASCIEPGGADERTVIAGAISPGAMFSYLVRTVNACPTNNTSIGESSSGARTVATCP